MGKMGGHQRRVDHLRPNAWATEVNLLLVGGVKVESNCKEGRK